MGPSYVLVPCSCVPKSQMLRVAVVFAAAWVQWLPLATAAEASSEIDLNACESELRQFLANQSPEIEQAR